MSYLQFYLPGCRIVHDAEIANIFYFVRTFIINYILLPWISIKFDRVLPSTSVYTVTLNVLDVNNIPFRYLDVCTVDTKRFTDRLVISKYVAFLL